MAAPCVPDLEDLVENCNDLIQKVRPDGAILYVNRAWCRTLGYTREEAAGLSVFDVIHPCSLGHCQELFLRVLKGESVECEECTFRTKDGREVTVEASANCRFRDGQPVVIRAILRDITERKRAEAAFHESEAIFRGFFENVAVGALQIDAHGRFVRVNDRYCAITGYIREELLGGMSSLDLDHPDEVEADRVRIERFVRNQEPVYEAEKRYVRKDGQVVWVHVSATQVHDATGKLLYAPVIIQDITERKRAEDALRRSEERFRSIVQDQTELICRFAPDLRLLWVNAAYAGCFGRTPDELVGRSFLEFVPEAEQDGVRQFFAAFTPDQPVRTQEHVVTDHLGQTRWQQWTNRAFFDEAGRAVEFQGVARDITIRRRAEEALRQSEVRYRTLVDATSAVTWTCPPDGRHVAPQPAWMAFTGQTAEEMLGDGWGKAVHPDDLPADQERWAASAVRGEPYSTEHRIRRHDGEWRWMSTHAVPIRDAGGRVVEWVGMNLDVTEQKRAEEALRHERARYQHLFEHTPVAIWEEDFTALVAWMDRLRAGGVTDLRGHLTAHPDEVRHALGLIRVIDVNQTALTQNAADSKEQLLRNLPALFDDTTRAAFLNELEGVWQGATSLEYESSGRRLDGRRLDLIIRLDAAHLHGRPDWSRVIVTGTDVTERKQAAEDRRHLEAQVRNAQKLESLGVLAGGVAHDFNNMLTSVLGYANLALLNLPDESPAAPMLREIENGARSAADLTRQMLDYSGRGTFQVKALRLHAVVRDIAKLLGTVVSKKASINLTLDPCGIEGDVTQVRQVVMNLITNASDALGGQSGVIRVRTGVVRADAASLRSPFLPDELPAGEYAFVEVADSGCGMSRETLAKIFDPFFTTKFTGRGLGLAAVLGIVKSHRGTIRVESSPGWGTVFQVLFPSFAGPPDAEPDTLSKMVQKRGSGTILVVEDVPILRRFARRALESAGFRVVEAADGREGIDVWLQHRGEVAAVLLDLTMPRMDGKEALRELRTYDPHLPVLLMSGYSDSDVTTRFQGLGVSGFLQKPFPASELIARVCHLLPPAEAAGQS